MKSKKNLLKNLNSIAVGFGLISFTAFTDVTKAEETPPLCKDVLGTFNSTTGSYSKTK